MNNLSAERWRVRRPGIIDSRLEDVPSVDIFVEISFISTNILPTINFEISPVGV